MLLCVFYFVFKMNVLHFIVLRPFILTSHILTANIFVALLFDFFSTWFVCYSCFAYLSLIYIGFLLIFWRILMLILICVFIFHLIGCFIAYFLTLQYSEEVFHINLDNETERSRNDIKLLSKAWAMLGWLGVFSILYDRNKNNKW